MAKNNKGDSWSNRIDIKYLVVRERVKENKVVMEHISIELIIANPLTKGMSLMSYKDHAVRMRIGPIMQNFFVWINLSNSYSLVMFFSILVHTFIYSKNINHFDLE